MPDSIRRPAAATHSLTRMSVVAIAAALLAGCSDQNGGSGGLVSRYEVHEPKFRPTAPLTAKELQAAAAAEPRIDLGVVAEVVSDGELLNVVAALDKPGASPTWIDDPGPGRGVLTTGPYATLESCRQNARQELIEWVWAEADLKQPDLGADPPAWWAEAIEEIFDECVVETHVEKREVSVGDVYLQHTLVRLSRESRGWLEERVAAWRAQATRERGVRRVTVGGAVVVGLVGWCHLLLRKSGPPKPLA